MGTSGWKYADWVGSFYPSKNKQFDYYRRIFDTAEINSTFYRSPHVKVVRALVRMAPEGFLFTAKVPREVTHKLKLDVEAGADKRMREFLEAILPLRVADKLGPLLLQLPPSYTFNPEGLNAFLDAIPAGWLLAVEFRDLSWMKDETFQLLRRHQVAYTIVDEPLLPPVVEITAPFAYIRWHGHGEKLWYYYLYSEEELREWVPRVKAVEAQCPEGVFGFWNNHWYGFAARNCVEMQEMLGLQTRMPTHVRQRLARVTDRRSKAKPTQQMALTEFTE